MANYVVRVSESRKTAGVNTFTVIVEIYFNYKYCIKHLPVPRVRIDLQLILHTIRAKICNVINIDNIYLL